ncbi:TPA: cupin domain-containing protein [Escherichia coli]|nr:cupin domain-containing protein [Escherichia coli]
MEYQLTLNWPDFLERHWQKRPVVLKRGFNNFIDPISPDELAGLAMESEVDSRLVSHQDGKWQVSHGPFEAIIDEELEPGDILYIPPGFPHEGYALENAMNYSVGFRAPNTRELISGFADYVLQRELGGNYYSDPDVPPRAHPADVLPQEMDKLREMMLELINQPEHFKQWFGEFISQSRHELDIAPPEPPYQPDEIYDALKQGDVLVRLGGLRVLRIGDDVYANGEKIDSPHRPALDALASNIALTAENFGDALEDPSFLAMLAALVNSGYWFFEG